MKSHVILKNWKKFQVILIILIFASIPLYGRFNNTVGKQKTVLIFQETDVFWWLVNETAIYLDIEFWRIVFEPRGFEVVVKYIGQEDFNSKKTIRHYSEISSQMFIIFNTHGARVLGSHFLKLDRYRTSRSIINAIGNTKACVVIASCYGELATKTLNMHTQNIECITFSNRTSQSFYDTEVTIRLSIFRTQYGLFFVDLLRLYSPYEAFQIMNRNESFHGAYWSFKTGLIN